MIRRKLRMKGDDPQDTPSSQILKSIKKITFLNLHVDESEQLFFPGVQ